MQKYAEALKKMFADEKYFQFSGSSPRWSNG